MISIAFGAPHVCDKEVARIVNENEKFKWRFINFVNQSDPIPRLLHNLQKFVEAIGEKINYHDDVVVAAIRATFDIGTSHPAGEIRDILRRRVLPKSISKTSDQTESDFSPVGYYVFLKRESTEHHDGRYDVHVVNCESTLMQNMLNHFQIKMEDTKHHEIGGYKSVLIDSYCIDTPQLPQTTVDQNQSDTELVVYTPAPEVSAILLLPFSTEKPINSVQLKAFLDFSF
jgi:hypothetical protein